MLIFFISISSPIIDSIEDRIILQLTKIKTEGVVVQKDKKPQKGSRLLSKWQVSLLSFTFEYQTRSSDPTSETTCAGLSQTIIPHRSFAVGFFFLCVCLIFLEEAKPIVDWSGGYLVVDDTVVDKPFAKKMDLVRWQWSDTHHDVVKGICVITFLWTDGRQHIPVDFRVYDPDGDGKTKNTPFRPLKMLAAKFLCIFTSYASRFMHKTGTNLTQPPCIIG